MNKEVKRGLKLKALDDDGHGLARIARLSEVDSDGDTYESGAFGEQWAQILPAHDWRAMPLGKARVHEAGDEALAELHINLGTEAGRQWHAALKFDLEHASGHPLQEWSYGFEVQDAGFEQRDGQRIRVLKRLKVFEVSPVVRGAGVGTATLAMKGAFSFADQIAHVGAGAGELLVRAKEIAELRRGQGREKRLSDARAEELAELAAGLKALGAAGDEVAALLADAGHGDAPTDAPADRGRADREFARFVATRTRLSGRR